MTESNMSESKTFAATDWVRTFIYGLCMGASDIVPGISGGTIAFIMGFYEDLLSSINSLNFRALTLLLSLRFQEFSRSVGWKFLSALILGILTAFITLASFFNYLLNHEVYRSFLYSGFLGLILASTYFCAKQIKKWNIPLFFSLLAGIAIAFFLTGTEMHFTSNDQIFDVKLPESYTYADTPIQNFDPQTHLLKNVSQSTLSALHAKNVLPDTTPVYSHTHQLQGTISDFSLPHSTPLINVWIICCGAIAISAMLLPGISGSYLLTILGMYSVVIAALVDFIHEIKTGHFDVEAFLILANMLLGIIMGALLFSKVVIWLLYHYRNYTLATLTGFMIGALRSVWPFWTYTYSLLPLKLEKGIQIEIFNPILPSLDSSLFLISCFFALTGFFLVFAIEFVAEKSSKTHN